MSDHKARGYAAEIVVKEDYEHQGRTLVAQNRTIRGGEIDLIMESSTEMVFIEVKVVNHIDDLHNYVTVSKLRTLHRTIANYQHRVGVPSSKTMRVDVVFVKDKHILHIFDHCELPAFS